MIPYAPNRFLMALILVLLVLAPFAQATELVLEKGDHVAIIGDSITEQKLYSRYIEDYLRACAPQLDLKVMQFGWSGERAEGFDARQENDVMPFAPDVATTCYGMNDGLYRAYAPEIGEKYRTPMESIVARFKAAGTTVVVGSPGVVDTKYFNPGWVENKVPPAVYNDNLAHLRDIARDVAQAAGEPFANVYDAMMGVMIAAKGAYGEDCDVAGRDGVHPRDNGHLVMAYAFLQAMGFDGKIGTITMDMQGNTEASAGHRVLDSARGTVRIESERYPFCFAPKPADAGDDHHYTRDILPYLPFNAELNRLTLIVKNMTAAEAEVQWGNAKARFTKEELAAGINLAAEFLDNPFSAAFAEVDAAVARKQAFETFMIKKIITNFRSLPGAFQNDAAAKEAIEGVRANLMREQQALDAAVGNAMQPVTHAITVTPIGAE